MTTTAILCGDVNPKLSLRYRATDDLILRASWSTGFRAPSLSQLGAGESLDTAYINCGEGQPFDALCGDFGASFGELELDQETLGNRGQDAENSEAVNLGLSWNLTDKAPPYASSPTNGYASSVHDWIGRLWTVRYTIRF